MGIAVACPNTRLRRRGSLWCHSCNTAGTLQWLRGLHPS